MRAAKFWSRGHLAIITTAATTRRRSIVEGPWEWPAWSRTRESVGMDGRPADQAASINPFLPPHTTHAVTTFCVSSWRSIMCSLEIVMWIVVALLMLTLRMPSESAVFDMYAWRNARTLRRHNVMSSALKASRQNLWWTVPGGLRWSPRRTPISRCTRTRQNTGMHQPARRSADIPSQNSIL